jgi:hypothetical protein
MRILSNYSHEREAKLSKRIALKRVFSLERQSHRPGGHGFEQLL